MRFAPGLAFVGCFVAAALLYGSGAGSDPASVAAYYADEGNRLRQIAGFAVLLAGCVLLLAYVVDVSHSPLALASGAGAALLLALGNALWAGTAVAIPFVVTVSRRGPAWFRVLGAATVLGLAAAYWYAPLALFLAWVAAGSLLHLAPSRA